MPGTRRRPGALALVPLCLLVLAAAACGGKKDAAPSSSTTNAATSEANASGLSKAQCLKLAQALGNASARIDDGLSGNIFKADGLATSPGFHGDEIVRDARVFASETARVPASVRAPFGTFRDTFMLMGTTMKDVNIGSGLDAPPAAIAQLQKFQAKIDRRKLAAAQARLSNWFSTSCLYY